MRTRLINAINTLVDLGILQSTEIRTNRGARFVARDVVDIVSA